MAEFKVDRIITRDRSSGKHHLRFVINGHTYANEQDNLDDAGAYDVVPELPEDIDSAKFCKRCFPEMHDHPITNE